MSIRIPPSDEIEISDGHSAAAYAVCPGQKPRISVRQRKILKIRFMELLEKIAAMFTRRGGCFDVLNPIGTADQEWIFACNCEGLNDHSTRTMDYSSLKTGLQPINDIKRADRSICRLFYIIPDFQQKTSQRSPQTPARSARRYRKRNLPERC